MYILGSKLSKGWAFMGRRWEEYIRADMLPIRKLDLFKTDWSGKKSQQQK